MDSDLVTHHNIKVRDSLHLNNLIIMIMFILDQVLS
jgi:hypothetical protein